MVSLVLCCAELCLCVSAWCNSAARTTQHTTANALFYFLLLFFFVCFETMAISKQNCIYTTTTTTRYDLSRQLKTNFAKEKQNNLKAHSINKVIKWIFMCSFVRYIRLGQNSNFKNNDYHVKLIKMWIRRIWIRQVTNNSNSKKETENQMKQMMFLPSNRDKMYMQQQMIISNEMQC